MGNKKLRQRRYRQHRTIYIGHVGDRGARALVQIGCEIIKYAADAVLTPTFLIVKEEDTIYPLVKEIIVQLEIWQADRFFKPYEALGIDIRLFELLNRCQYEPNRNIARLGYLIERVVDSARFLLNGAHEEVTPEEEMDLLFDAGGVIMDSVRLETIKIIQRVRPHRNAEKEIDQKIIQPVCKEYDWEP